MAEPILTIFCLSVSLTISNFYKTLSFYFQRVYCSLNFKVFLRNSFVFISVCVGRRHERRLGMSFDRHPRIHEKRNERPRRLMTTLTILTTLTKTMLTILTTLTKTIFSDVDDFKDVDDFNDVNKNDRG
jgi:hypothetical protein